MPPFVFGDVRIDSADVVGLLIFVDPSSSKRVLHVPGERTRVPLSSGGDRVQGAGGQRRDGAWIAAPYIPGTFIINLGDLFKVWTNNVYVSNFHRVVNLTGKERYSFATFLNTDYDAVVQSVATWVSRDNPPKYQPIRAGDYLLGRFREVQGYKL